MPKEWQRTDGIVGNFSDFVLRERRKEHDGKRNYY